MLYICKYVHENLCRYNYVYVHICIYICTCVHINTYIYIRMYIYVLFYLCWAGPSKVAAN